MSIRHHTAEEKTLFQETLNAQGEPTDVLINFESHEMNLGLPFSIKRGSFQLLKPSTWLNDDIINGFMALLRTRDADLNPNHRNHFATTFFFSSLFVNGRYTYSNVRKWHRFFPGGDIFHLDKIFIPINIENIHWTCAAIYMQARKIEYYDSLKGDGMVYMTAILKYIQDEWMRTNQSELPHLEEWTMTTVTCPEQHNNFDCGVFVCFYARCLGLGLPLLFEQQDITLYGRQYIGISILKGVLLM